MRAIGTLLAIVAVYFGSRAWNREATSRDVRKQAEEVLARSIGAQNADTAMSRYHRTCFDETYRTGWGRRQASKFDEEKYVGCLGDHLRKEREFAPALAAGRTMASAPPIAVDSERAAVQAAPTPRLTRDTSGALRIMEPRLLSFGGPYKTYTIAFRVAGEPMPLHPFLLLRSLCDGQPQYTGRYSRSQGPLRLGFEQDAAGSSVIDHAQCPARCHSCSIELMIGEGQDVPASNTLVVKLY